MMFQRYQGALSQALGASKYNHSHIIETRDFLSFLLVQSTLERYSLFYRVLSTYFRYFAYRLARTVSLQFNTN